VAEARSLPRVLVVTGTNTGVGKTVATAALAVALRARGLRVAVAKPTQTGVSADEPGDLQEVCRLAGAVGVDGVGGGAASRSLGAGQRGSDRGTVDPFCG
jgi:uncharacterized NAD-dependent epimerase/dehydratase family protein